MIRRHGGLLLTLGLVAAAAAVRLGDLDAVLEYRAGEIMAGDWWRVATSHLAHWSPGHVLWDCLTLLVLGVAFDRVAKGEAWRLLFAVAASAIAIPLALLVLQPELLSYRGLSGIDSSLFVLVGTLALARAGSRLERLVVGAALAGFVAKVVAELSTGGALFVQDMGVGVVAVPLSHGAGAIAGLVAAVARGSFRNLSMAVPNSQVTEASR